MSLSLLRYLSLTFIFMRSVHILSWVLVIIGALNWGLVGAFSFDLVSTIFGVGSVLSKTVYILVGVAGLYELLVLLGVMKST
mgnify:FL=1